MQLKSPSKDVEQHLAKGKGFSWGKTVEKDDLYVLVKGAQRVEVSGTCLQPQLVLFT